ncbi:N-acetylmuramoyl-L-alanine amidase [Neobacillus sp. 19]|uniref:N-acetylmuramoyl-L-alanine amidase family protein n=1 Tax=Neobacillus sp. 19 TaxID=3394458 RepID=UPI003BF68195
MTFKIAFCAGHGGGNSTPGKRTPDGEYEWTFNNTLALAFEDAINQYEGVALLRTDDRSGKTDVGLSARTNKANSWGADIYISFHHNANTSKWGDWGGIETFVYTSPSANSLRLAASIHPKFVNAYGLKDRGIKRENLHIVRESKMPAVLLEGGFMDSVIDIKKLRDPAVLIAAGYAVAEGVAEYAKLKKKMVTQTAKNGWALESGVWYFYKNGARVKNDWAQDSKKLWYFLGDDGAMISDKWVRWKDKWYYMLSDGKMATGEITVKGKPYKIRDNGTLIMTDKDGAIVE